MSLVLVITVARFDFTNDGYKLERKTEPRGSNPEDAKTLGITICINYHVD